MCSNLSTPYSWDSLDKSVLQRSANLIEDLSPQAIRKIVIENCKEYLDFPSIALKNVSIVKHTLLGVDEAAVIAQFKKYPIAEYNNLYQLAGMARLIQVEEGILPVVLMFPITNKTTLEHESIHLCQWLNNQSYQLTLAERIATFHQNVKIVIKNALNTSPERALDLLIRLTCYKVWMELEAHYFKNTQGNILTLAQRSSVPFESFGGFLHEFCIYKDIPNAIDRCRKEFARFCNELESQVEWIRDLVAKSGDKTLYEALWCSKEDDVEKMMLGPITNEEIASYYDMEGNDDEDDD